MHRKIILPGLIIAGILIIFMFIENGAVAQDQVIAMNLDEVMSSVLYGNKNINRLTHQINIAQSRYDTETWADGTYEKDSKKKILDDLIYEKQQFEKDAAIDAERIYYGILIQAKKVETQKDKIKSIEDRYELKKKEVETGKDTKSSLLTLEADMQQAYAALSGLENNYEGLIMDLNNLMGNSLDVKLSLEDREIPVEDIPVPDMDNLVPGIIYTNYQVTSILRDIQLSHMQEAGASPERLAQLQDDIARKEYDLEDLRISLEKQVRSGYNNILNLKDTVELKKLQYDKALMQLEEARLRNSLGLLSSSGVDSNRVTAEEAEWAYLGAKLDLYVAVRKYRSLIN